MFLSTVHLYAIVNNVSEYLHLTDEQSELLPEILEAFYWEYKFKHRPTDGSIATRAPDKIVILPKEDSVVLTRIRTNDATGERLKFTLILTKDDKIKQPGKMAPENSYLDHVIGELCRRHRPDCFSLLYLSEKPVVTGPDAFKLGKIIYDLLDVFPKEIELTFAYDGLSAKLTMEPLSPED